MDEHKTKNLKFPKWLSPKLLRHFIRGYFDGDGYTGINKKRKDAEVSIIGTESFIKNTIKVIKTKLNITVLKKKHISKGILCLRICGNIQVLKFLNWIYKDSSLFLTRKHDKYKELLQIRYSIENKPKKLCSLCKNEHYGKGLCFSHWRKARYRELKL